MSLEGRVKVFLEATANWAIVDFSILGLSLLIGATALLAYMIFSILVPWGETQ